MSRVGSVYVLTGPHGQKVTAPDGKTIGSTGGATSGGTTVSVLLNQGAGTFAARVDYSAGTVGTDGVAIGDVNNAGWPDVFITEYGRVRLFLNNANGTFTEITREAGLENPLWGTSASFVDYDRDG